MLNVRLYRYAEVFFDLDGVLVDTNETKRRNIHAATTFLGDELADRFTEFFITHNGITRERKIASWFASPEAQIILERYNGLNAATLGTSALLPGATDLLGQLRARNIPVHIFTGADEREAIALCRTKGLFELVAGIHGGPVGKSENIDSGSHRHPILYFGDSRFDYELAVARHFDFVFVAGVSQFVAWPSFFREHPILGTINHLDEIRFLYPEDKP